ncbi:MAG: pyruvate, phosphate dikinase [Vampirovibrionales bacterium]|nr:pyruvate, phosphate dikinase [Vampirovibrionales bacterium]
MATKRVYLFDEGNASMRDLLGGKGANLAEMTNLGLPVPPGFTLTTATCNEYLELGGRFPEGLLDSVKQAVAAVEAKLGRTFGDAQNPLLMSVRSGAKFSMPGMMETILNLGLNNQTIQGLIAQSGNERFAWDSYRRFLTMFSSVVLGIHRDEYEEIMDEMKRKRGAKLDTDLSAADLKELTAQYQAHTEKRLGKPFPQDPMTQLQMAIESVFHSWNIPRAIAYRNFHGIDHTLGTAVNVQAMVFGNMGSDSATGVAFTRNPATGENLIYGEYLTNAQGEDVVAGIRTPNKISELEKEMPEMYRQFMEIANKLEKHYKDMQDMEFTIEKGRLFLLQTRNGKRTVASAVRTAVEMVGEGLISKEDGMLRVDANQLPQLLLPRFDQAQKAEAEKSGRLLARGINASPGAATGVIVFCPDEAVERASKGEDVLLVRVETSPDDVHGMIAARGVLTSRGGNTSHAAVVARGMGKPCVVGCESITVDMKAEALIANGKTLKSGDLLSIDGSTGEVYEGRIHTLPPEMNADLATLMDWSDGYRRLGVRANADTPEDAERAVELGASGIGLCRTEHMFMAAERLPVVQEMIIATTTEARQAALNKLLPMQRDDFKAIFKSMAGKPVTVRLIDPPLHEFLPKRDELVEETARLSIQSPNSRELQEKQDLLKTVETLSEANPMMGFRGCRLGVIYPEIVAMQVRAIFEAAVALKKAGVDVKPEIMIPLVSDASELKFTKTKLEAMAQEIMNESGVQIDYAFGTMIEIPRAALTADKIAEHAQFFSFGTNDLTQMTYGFSRDDAEEKFLKRYLEMGLFETNPFEVLDRQGVGQLVEIAKEKGRSVKPNLKLGVCGEHGGEARSVQFAHFVGLDYVSCSPFRIPVARLAAAQGAILEKQKKSDFMLASV